MKKSIVTIATILVLSGCGGGGGDSDPVASTNTPTNQDWKKTYDVGYTLNGTELTTCNHSSGEEGIWGDSNVHTCYWWCGRYEGASPVTVFLTFKRDDENSTWQLDRESVSTPHPHCDDLK